MQICPCCKQVIRAPKAVKAEKIDPRITKDLAKVHAAIAALIAAESNPFYADIREAIAAEKLRMHRALDDRRLLWNIYRRIDKGAPYFVAARQDRKAA